MARSLANPPYVALCRVEAELQESLRRFNAADDPSFALRSNYWCAFLAACLRLLKRDGSLAFVLPAAWDHAQYARGLRQTVLTFFRSVEVHRSLEPLFPDVREGRIMLVAKGHLQKPRVTRRIDHPTAASLIAALGEPSRTSSGLRISLPESSDGLLTSFNELFTVGIGAVTGDVDYFLLTESQRLAHDLPERALRPVLSRARHLTSAQMTKAQWERLKRADERIWLFSPDGRLLKNRAVRRYLQYGEKTCDLSGYKLSNRDPWYGVPSVGPGIGFMSGMATLGPWLSLRSMRGLTATNTLYVITSNRTMSLDEQAGWALSLLSTETRRQHQARARRYPDGLAKFEPHDISQLRLLMPKRFEGSRAIYERAIRLLLTGNLNDAVAIADASVVTANRKR